MKGRTAQSNPRSACDHYEPGERVTAWEPSDGASQDIFKQLRLNLNQYERRYNQSKEREPPKSTGRTCSPSSFAEEKENCIKLPLLPSLPLKHAHSNKEPFAIKNRNILDDAMNSFEENKPRQHRGFRLKIRKVRCEEPLNLMGPEFRLNFLRDVSPPQEEPAQTERGLKKMQSRRGRSELASQLAEYDFSDARFLPQSVLSRCSGKENR